MSDHSDAVRLSQDEEDDQSVSQYVSFILNDECYAFPMLSVREIIRVPETVQVPLTPPSLIGLANLRGAVIPVLSLRTLLQMPEQDVSDSSRVLVVDHGRPMGLLVDKIASVMNVDGADVESASGVRTTLDTDVLSGAVKNVRGMDLVLLLDPGRILDTE